MDLYLIDGNSYLYRAYYAIRMLSSSKGLPTNAIYGFTNMLLKIIKEKKPDRLLISFDSPVPTKRHKIYEAYKAHRPEAPSDLIEQIPYVRKIVSAFNIKTFELPGYEADDILGTIAKKAAAKGLDVYIVTADKDMLQLVDEKIKIYDPMKDKIFDKNFIIERFGIEPERIPEFMALTGDSVDNIPGIKGIGEKTAKELLSKFDSIEDLLQNTYRIDKEKLRLLISKNADIVRLSKKLATLDTSAPIDIDIDDLSLNEPDWEKLLQLFKELEFVSLIKLIPTVAKSEISCEIIQSSERFEDLYSSIKDEVAINVEVEGTGPIAGQIIGMAFCKDKKVSHYLSFCNLRTELPLDVDKRLFLEKISALFSDKEITKIGHNLKDIVTILKRNGIEFQGRCLDIMIASYLINPNKNNHNLADIALEYLSYRKKTRTEFLGNRTSFLDVPMQETALYVCEGAALIFELKEILFGRLEEEKLVTLYENIEMPLIHVLSDMELKGVKIDSEKIYEISKEIEREIEGIKKRIYFLAGEEFNINSPKQLRKILFDNLKLQPGKKKKTGFSTEMSVLEELAQLHELPREILNYRTLSKMKTTYIDVLPTLINPETGRVHTSFNQTMTATGRLSSSEPNLQNIPIKGEWGRRIRETFVAEEESLLMSADYSQIELRILAHLSNDEGLIEAFRENVDVHSRTASEIFNVDIDKVTPEMRRVAKTVNFSVIYGVSPFGLSETLNISKDEAKNYIDRYFERHLGVKKYIEEIILQVKERGYVTTLLGRKRPLPEINSKNSNIRQQAERIAINSPIQGTAADIIKIAMINIWRKLKAEGLKSSMVLQVHDELLFEVPTEEIEALSEIVKNEMEGAIILSVPIVVSVKYGRNWAEVH